MHIGTAVFLIFLIWLFVAFPAFRKVVLVLAGIGVVTFMIMIGTDSSSSRKPPSPQDLAQAEERRRLDEAARLRASTLISLNEVSITQPSLKRIFGEEWTLSGVLLNSSPHVLEGVTVEVTIRDCVVTPSCPIVGERTATVTPPTEIPPSQGRSFQQTMTFKGVPQTSGANWSYEIKGTRAH